MCMYVYNVHIYCLYMLVYTYFGYDVVIVSVNKG